MNTYTFTTRPGRKLVNSLSKVVANISLATEQKLFAHNETNWNKNKELLLPFPALQLGKANLGMISKTLKLSAKRDLLQNK